MVPALRELAIGGVGNECCHGRVSVHECVSVCGEVPVSSAGSGVVLAGFSVSSPAS